MTLSSPRRATMAEISVKPKENPEPTRENLRLITQRVLPAAQLVAAVRAAGFEVRSFGPIDFDPNHQYIGECFCEDLWHGVSTLTSISDDPQFQANARLVVEVAAIHKAAEE